MDVKVPSPGGPAQKVTAREKERKRERERIIADLEFTQWISESFAKRIKGKIIWARLNFNKGPRTHPKCGRAST